jgi:hypothetical protein
VARRSRTSHAELEGIRELLKGLGYAEKHWKDAEDAYFEIAVKSIIERARATARSEGRLEAKAAEDLKRGGLGVVVYGGQGYSRGAEFGSYQYKQFETWRGNGDDAGYFLWPTIREYRDEDFINEYAENVLTILKQAFPD